MQDILTALWVEQNSVLWDVCRRHDMQRCADANIISPTSLLSARTNPSDSSSFEQHASSCPSTLRIPPKLSILTRSDLSQISHLRHAVLHTTIASTTQGSNPFPNSRSPCSSPCFINWPGYRISRIGIMSSMCNAQQR
ncbi:hypothetical protein IG631_11445 [Alternaria alternata]|nr:hypothetical protein IG631_11445 [Alternaria alternata]